MARRSVQRAFHSQDDDMLTHQEALEAEREGKRQDMAAGQWLRVDDPRFKAPVT